MNISSKNTGLEFVSVIALTMGLYSTTVSANPMMDDQQDKTSQQPSGMTGADAMGGQNMGMRGPGIPQGPQNMGMRGRPPMQDGQNMRGGPGMMRRAQNMGMGNPGMQGENQGVRGIISHSPATVENNLQSFKTRLGITKDQQTAWDAYEKASWDLAFVHTEKFKAMCGPQKDVFGAAESEIQFIEKKLQAQKATLAAFRTLFDTLTENQKNKANSMRSGCGQPNMMF